MKPNTNKDNFWAPSNWHVYLGEPMFFFKRIGRKSTAKIQPKMEAAYWIFITGYPKVRKCPQESGPDTHINYHPVKSLGLSEPTSSRQEALLLPAFPGVLDVAHDLVENMISKYVKRHRHQHHSFSPTSQHVSQNKSNMIHKEPGGFSKPWFDPYQTLGPWPNPYGKVRFCDWKG